MKPLPTDLVFGFGIALLTLAYFGALLGQKAVQDIGGWRTAWTVFAMCCAGLFVVFAASVLVIFFWKKP